MSGWQLKLCDPQLTRAISERFRDEVLYDKALYKSTLLFGARCVRRTNRLVIAMMFVRPTVRLSVRRSVCLGRACIVIIRCTL